MMCCFGSPVSSASWWSAKQPREQCWTDFYWVYCSFCGIFKVFLCCFFFYLFISFTAVNTLVLTSELSHQSKRCTRFFKSHRSDLKFFQTNTSLKNVFCLRPVSAWGMDSCEISQVSISSYITLSSVSIVVLFGHGDMIVLSNVSVGMTISVCHVMPRTL